MTGTVQSATGDALRIAWDDGTEGPTYRPARDLAAGDRVEVVGRELRRVEPLDLDRLQGKYETPDNGAYSFDETLSADEVRDDLFPLVAEVRRLRALLVTRG